MYKIILILIITMCCTQFSICVAKERSSLKISLTAKDRTIQSIVNEIKDQTGYGVVFPDNFYSMKVSGQFINVSLDGLFNRVLKGLNYTTITIEDQSLVLVNIYDSSYDQNKYQLGGNINDEITPQSKYFDELVKIGIENEEEFQEYINNPLSIDPVTSMTIGELRQKFSESKANLQDFLSNELNIEPMSGVRLGQLKKIIKNNSNDFDTFLSDPNSLDPDTGINIQELRRIALRGEEELKNVSIGETLP